MRWTPIKNEYAICGKYTIIYLQEVDGERLETAIDTEDLQMLLDSKISWKARWNKQTESYYVISARFNPQYHLHRYLTNCPHGFVVDHINHDPLDNRRSCNLRVCSTAENLQNRLINKNNSSGFMGVSWNKRKSAWQAYIYVNYKKKDLGYFKDIETANNAVKLAKEKYHPFQNKEAR